MVSLFESLSRSCPADPETIRSERQQVQSIVKAEWSSWYEEHEDMRCTVKQRRFSACVFCAMLHWGEYLRDVFLAGPQCFMHDPAKVAELLSAEKYHESWPIIPRENLMASAVDLPHLDLEGNLTFTKVLMHKRRVPPEALQGSVAVDACEKCYHAFSKRKPILSEPCLANWLWIGRHESIFQRANVGHQLLLPLGRVVSTKVYLSSKGKDETAKQHATTWRQHFLQERALQKMEVLAGIEEMLQAEDEGAGKEKDTSARGVLQRVFRRSNFASEERDGKKLILAGHSFGGASSAHFFDLLARLPAGNASDALSATYFHAYRAALSESNLVFVHLSKSGGTALCELAKLNGCSRAAAGQSTFSGKGLCGVDGSS